MKTKPLQPVCAKLTLGKTAWIVALCFLFHPHLSHSEIGNVEMINPKSLPQIDMSSFENEAKIPSSQTTQAPKNLDFSLLDRPWELETAAGPTAFVLDQYQMELWSSHPAIYSLMGMDLLLVGAKFGLFNSVTVDASAGFGVAAVGARWNFLNTESWSFSVRPWAGVPFMSSNSYYSSGYHPMILEWAASKVVDADQRWHFTLEGGKNHITESYYSYSSTYNPDGSPSSSNMNLYQYSRDYYGARAAATYELRLNARHALTFWLSPDVSSYQSNSDSSSSYSHLTASLKLGFGYQYWTRHFGAEIGLALGPSWEKYSSSYSDSFGSYGSNYSSFNSITGLATAGINYRI